MKHFDSLVIDVDEFKVVELLEDEVTRVEQNIATLVSAQPLQKHLKTDAVVQIFAGMQFKAEIDANIVKQVENRPPAFCQLIEGGLDQTPWTLRPGVNIRPC